MDEEAAPCQVDSVYEEKHRLLSDYYDHINKMNNRLRHRIYHVKKEINHLKQLKRVLCERLLLHRAVIIDSDLKIPDNDSSMSVIERTGEIAGTSGDKNDATSSKGHKRKQAQMKSETSDEQNKNKEQNKKRKVKDDAKRNIISIIESIVADTHKESEVQNKEIKENCKTNASGEETTAEEMKNDKTEETPRKEINNEHMDSDLIVSELKQNA